MIDQRRVRFATLDPFAREDLPLIVEVWRDDVVRAPWATREVMKLAAVLTRYVLDPDSMPMSMGGLENNHHLMRQDVRRALGVMSIFGVVGAFSIDKDELRVALNLTFAQKVRVYELRRAVADMTAACEMRHDHANELPSPFASSEGQQPWLPDAPETPRTAVPAEASSEALPASGPELWLLRRMAEVMRAELEAAERGVRAA